MSYALFGLILSLILMILIVSIQSLLAIKLSDRNFAKFLHFKVNFWRTIREKFHNQNSLYEQHIKSIECDKIVATIFGKENVRHKK